MHLNTISSMTGPMMKFLTKDHEMDGSEDKRGIEGIDGSDGRRRSMSSTIGPKKSVIVIMSGQTMSLILSFLSRNDNISSTHDLLEWYLL